MISLPYIPGLCYTRKLFPHYDVFKFAGNKLTGIRFPEVLTKFDEVSFSPLQGSLPPLETLSSSNKVWVLIIFVIFIILNFTYINIIFRNCTFKVKKGKTELYYHKYFGIFLLLLFILFGFAVVL